MARVQQDSNKYKLHSSRNEEQFQFMTCLQSFSSRYCLQTTGINVVPEAVNVSHKYINKYPASQSQNNSAQIHLFSSIKRFPFFFQTSSANLNLSIFLHKDYRCLTSSSNVLLAKRSHLANQEIPQYLQNPHGYILYQRN